MAVLQSTLAHAEPEQDFEIGFVTRKKTVGYFGLHAGIVRPLHSKIRDPSRMRMTSTRR